MASLRGADRGTTRGPTCKVTECKTPQTDIVSYLCILDIQCGTIPALRSICIFLDNLHNSWDLLEIVEMYIEFYIILYRGSSLIVPTFLHSRVYLISYIV